METHTRLGNLVEAIGSVEPEDCRNHKTKGYGLEITQCREEWEFPTLATRHWNNFKNNDI